MGVRDGEGVGAACQGGTRRAFPPTDDERSSGFGVFALERVRRGLKEEGSLPLRARARQVSQGAEPRAAGDVRVEGVHDAQGDRSVDVRDGA